MRGQVNLSHSQASGEGAAAPAASRFDVTGRRVLLVGAAGHVGRGLAKALSGAGARLALGDLDAGALDAAPFSAAVDVTDEAAVAGFVDAAAEALGGVDALVNAAGLLPIAKADALAPADFRACLDVNLTGAFLLATAARRHMGEGATQVHVASVSSLVANPGYAAYAASKAGLAHLVRVLAREWARDGITVNALAPSMLEEGMAAHYLADPRFRERALSEIPLRRFATVEDLAGPLQMLLSPAGGYITGQVIPVDGGRTIV
jgi:NAD(P)-dependent dehydrogenase (short-subunit alcohol dehydrogenase family)